MHLPGCSCKHIVLDWLAHGTQVVQHDDAHAGDQRSNARHRRVSRSASSTQRALADRHDSQHAAVRLGAYVPEIARSGTGIFHPRVVLFQVTKDALEEHAGRCDALGVACVVSACGAKPSNATQSMDACVMASILHAGSSAFSGRVLYAVDQLLTSDHSVRGR